MDDIRSKQRKPDDPRYIGIVFADGSGKFVVLSYCYLFLKSALPKNVFRTFFPFSITHPSPLTLSF